MIFIVGVQAKTRRLEKSPQACPHCAHHDVYLKRVDQYISFFFFPLIPFKRGVSFLGCENCNTLLDQNSSTVSFRKPGGSKQCESCGKSAAEDFNYCPYCGKWL